MKKKILFGMVMGMLFVAGGSIFAQTQKPTEVIPIAEVRTTSSTNTVKPTEVIPIAEPRTPGNSESSGVRALIGEWVGTAWIAIGNVVSATNLKSNLDFLYDNKAPIPQNCSGPNNVLGWSNGTWVCNQKGAPQSCSFNGTTIPSGNTVTAYSAASVGFGEQCQSERRSCSNGALSGTYQFSSCSEAGARSCTFTNLTSVAHGDSVTAFQASGVRAGERCVSELRTCNDGSLSGSYPSPTCLEIPAASCEFNGDVVVNGDTVTAYEFANVPFGEACQAQARTCTNGTLSGSYTAPGCTVQPAATCVFNGNTLQDGETVEAYSAASVPFGETCGTEVRTCNNGALTGSNTFGSCSVQPQETARFYQRDFVVAATEYICREESFFNGETAAWITTPRDENNECPGIFNFKSQRTTYHLQNHPGIKYESNRYEGMDHDLASDAGTLLQLCKLKGYDYVVGNAPRSGLRGFRSLASPGNNRLTYGSPTARFTTRSVSINQTFNGRYGWVECSNSPLTRSTSTSSSTGNTSTPQQGGGENNGAGRDQNLTPNESR